MPRPADPLQAGRNPGSGDAIVPCALRVTGW